MPITEEDNSRLTIASSAAKESPPSFVPVFVSQQNVYYTSSQQLHLGVLSPTIDDDDNKCLVDVNSRPRLLECSYAATKHMKLTWMFTQVNCTKRTTLVNVQRSLCS